MDTEFVGPWEDAWSEFEDKATRTEYDRILYWLERFAELTPDEQRRALEVLKRERGDD